MRDIFALFRHSSSFRLSLRRSAQLDGKRQSGPDANQSGDIDGQKGPSPGGKPCGKVGRGKQAGEGTGVDIAHQHTHKGAKKESQNSSGHHGKGNGPELVVCTTITERT